MKTAQTVLVRFTTDENQGCELRRKCASLRSLRRIKPYVRKQVRTENSYRSFRRTRSLKRALPKVPNNCSLIRHKTNSVRSRHDTRTTDVLPETINHAEVIVRCLCYSHMPLVLLCML